MRMKLLGTLCGILWIATGCSTEPRTPYVPGFRYAPEPALAVMLKQGTQSPSLSVMVSVIGIRRGSADNRTPDAMEVRMRFENQGHAAVTFDPHSASLVTGGLQSFDPPDAAPPQPITIAPGQTQSQTLYFPFPPGTLPRTMALDTLRLRWQVQIEGQSYLQTAYFERASQLYYGE